MTYVMNIHTGAIDSCKVKIQSLAMRNENSKVE